MSISPARKVGFLDADGILYRPAVLLFRLLVQFCGRWDPPTLIYHMRWSMHCWYLTWS